MMRRLFVSRRKIASSAARSSTVTELTRIFISAARLLNRSGRPMGLWTSRTTGSGISGGAGGAVDGPVRPSDRRTLSMTSLDDSG
jgi:hypothetical protein